MLRVKTDESIITNDRAASFGLVQKLRYLSGEDIWQTRFLAPDDVQDGTYTARLVLRDRIGHTLPRSPKTFVIASKAAGGQNQSWIRKRYQRGQVVKSEGERFRSTPHAVCEGWKVKALLD